MKKHFNYCISAFILTSIWVCFACSDKLDLQPPGVVSLSTISSSYEDIDKLAIGAYAMLTGWNTNIAGAGAWMTTVTNWAYGDAISDDAEKGSEAADQPALLEIETFSASPSNVYFNAKWIALYEGIKRTNEVLRVVNTASVLSAAQKTRLQAEMRVLRGHFYFEAYKFWKNVPYIDENTSNANAPNNIDVLSKIIEDFKFGKTNLPDVAEQSGRVDKWVATAYLGKAYLYAKDYQKAKAEFDLVVGAGKFSLVPNITDIYDPSKKNANTEAIFTVKHAIKDGANDNGHGDVGNLLIYVQGGPGGCCGFLAPTENLANAYKTRNGLPISDFTGAGRFEFNDDATTGGNMSDFGIESSAPFTPFAGELDPRIDFTLGRRGIPFAGWGVHPGAEWSRSETDQSSYTSKKRFLSKENFDAGYGAISGWGYVTTAIDYHVIRYADVLLMLAECEVELNNLAEAQELVDQVRARAAKSSRVQDSTGTSDAANYQISLYGAGHAAFATQEKARAAVQFERRLELALEGHRFFDIVRWGIAKDVLDEKKKGEPISYAKSINFVIGKHELFPIPQKQIDLSTVAGQATLKQNPNY